MEVAAQILCNILIAASVYSIAALGFNFLFSTTKVIDLSYGSAILLGGYVFFGCMNTLGLSTALALVCSVAAAGTFGLIIERSVFRPMRVREASTLAIMIASLGILMAAQAVISIIFSSRYHALPITDTAFVTFLGATLSLVQAGSIAGAVLLSVVLFLVTRRTSLGLTIRAVADDAKIAETVGIPTQHVFSIVAFIAATLGAIAGMAYGADLGLTPYIGLTLTLKAIIAVIIGGTGNVFGGVAGALLLSSAENLGGWYIDSSWKDAIAFATFFIFLIVRPEGMFPNK